MFKKLIISAFAAIALMVGMQAPASAAMSVATPAAVQSEVASGIVKVGGGKRFRFRHWGGHHRWRRHYWAPRRYYRKCHWHHGYKHCHWRKYYRHRHHH